MTHSRRRDVLKAAGTVAVVCGLAGCAGQSDVGTGSAQDGNETEDDDEEQAQPDGTGAFRVVHASPDAPNVDIYVDEEPAIEDLGFRDVSPYEELDPGPYQVQVTAAGDEEAVVFDEEIEIEDGITNTAVAYGEAAGGPEDGFTVDVLEDDITDPGDAMSRLRLFHASPDAEAVDVVVTQPPEDAAGDGQPEDAPPEEGQPGDGPPEDAPPEEGQPENGQPEDAPPEEGQPEDGQPEDTPPSGPPQQGEPLFESIAFGETDTQEVPAGDYTLEVVPANGAGQQPEGEQPEGEPEQTQQGQEDGQPAQEPVATFDASTESQTVYSAFATGYVDPSEALTEEAPEFEVVIVEDAQAGERSDSGSE